MADDDRSIMAATLLRNMKIIGHLPTVARTWCVLMSLSMLGLSGCSWLPSQTSRDGPPVPDRLPLVFQAADKARWEAMPLPGKPRTAFRHTTHDGRKSLEARAQSSASMLRQRVRVDAQALGWLSFQWQVDQLIEGADMRLREREDSPARVVLAFDGDRSRFSARNAMLNELTRTLTGEDMPYAMLMYVWSNDLPVETVIVNPRTDRIRKIVVESGSARLKQWLHYKRDVRADFERAFGEPPQTLQGVAIMTDSDNTHGFARAWYGEIRLDARSP